MRKPSHTFHTPTAFSAIVCYWYRHHLSLRWMEWAAGKISLRRNINGKSENKANKYATEWMRKLYQMQGKGRWDIFSMRVSGRANCEGSFQCCPSVWEGGEGTVDRSALVERNKEDDLVSCAPGCGCGGVWVYLLYHNIWSTSRMSRLLSKWDRIPRETIFLWTNANEY